jgi:hypothetical protein
MAFYLLHRMGWGEDSIADLPELYKPQFPQRLSVGEQSLMEGLFTVKALRYLAKCLSVLERDCSDLTERESPCRHRCLV